MWNCHQGATACPHNSLDWPNKFAWVTKRLVLWIDNDLTNDWCGSAASRGECLGEYVTNLSHRLCSKYVKAESGNWWLKKYMRLMLLLLLMMIMKQTIKYVAIISKFRQRHNRHSSSNVIQFHSLTWQHSVPTPAHPLAVHYHASIPIHALSSSSQLSVPFPQLLSAYSRLWAVHHAAAKHSLPRPPQYDPTGSLLRKWTIVEIVDRYYFLSMLCMMMLKPDSEGGARQS